jgi:hydroxymethylglutaryl-CoA synthase
VNGIVSYGVYLPYWRLQRSAIGGVLGGGGGRGSRSVASYDEDTASPCATRQRGPSPPS